MMAFLTGWEGSQNPPLAPGSWDLSLCSQWASGEHIALESPGGLALHLSGLHDGLTSVGGVHPNAGCWGDSGEIGVQRLGLETTLRPTTLSGL